MIAAVLTSNGQAGFVNARSGIDSVAACSGESLGSVCCAFGGPLAPPVFVAPATSPKTVVELCFSFEAFLMAGGWLVFGDAQALYAPTAGGREAARQGGAKRR